MNQFLCREKKLLERLTEKSIFYGSLSAGRPAQLRNLRKFWSHFPETSDFGLWPFPLHFFEFGDKVEIEVVQTRAAGEGDVDVLERHFVTTGGGGLCETVEA